MTTTSLDLKRRRLLSLLAECPRVVVAFSAGVDSTVVARAAQEACGSAALAVTASSPSLASGELEAACRLAGEIGIRHEIIHTQEFDSGGYTRNASNRCYFCKSELYSRLEMYLANAADRGVIVNGANLDDCGDHRPGMQAASEHHVRSPLIEAQFTKSDVRALAAFWQLSVADKPAMPCLASRIAYGVDVTPERVSRVDQAEIFLKQELGLRELRVRCEANDLARIEVPLQAVPQLLEPEFSARVHSELTKIGFRYVTVDLAGFRSGSLNAVVPVEELTVFSARKPQ